jgi:hypothetical protein
LDDENSTIISYHLTETAVFDQTLFADERERQVISHGFLVGLVKFVDPVLAVHKYGYVR